MVSSFKFESFGKKAHRQSTVFLPKGTLERIKKEAFQAGYGQGHQTASQALGIEKTKAALTLSQSLEDFNFTSIEARQAVLSSLQPLIFKMVEVVLPGVFKHALGEIITAQIKDLASKMTDGAILVKCSPENQPIIDDLLAENSDTAFGATCEVSTSSDIDCGPNEIWLSSPSGERNIDLDTAMDSVQLAVSDFFNMASEDQSYG